MLMNHFKRLICILAMMLASTAIFVVAAPGSASKVLPLVGVVLGLVILVAVCFGIFYFVMEIIMLIDCIKRDFEKKLQWLLLIWLVPFGWVFYYFRIKKKGIQSKELKKAKQDTLALVSLILGLASLFLFTGFGLVIGPVAVVLGVMARKNIEKSKNLGGYDLATAGIIFGALSFALNIFFWITYAGFIIFSINHSNQENYFNSENQFKGQLNITYATTGEYFERYGDCYMKQGTDNLFSQDESICVSFGGVTGFEVGQDGLNWFDADVKLLDDSGRVIEYQKNVFGETGHLFLQNNILENKFIYRPLNDLKPGAYTYEIMLYDKISRKQSLIDKEFVIK